MPKPKILWVDDDPKFLNPTIKIFKKRGFNFDSYTSSLKALNIVKKRSQKYAVIVVDLSMPELNGVDFIRSVRSENHKIPIIIASAYNGQPNWEEEIERLGEEFERIDKPISVVESEDFTKIMEMFSKYISNKATGRAEEGDNSVDVNISLEEFWEMPIEHQLIISDSIYKKNKIKINSFFENNGGSDWLVIDGNTQEIFLWGLKNKEPYLDDLNEIAEMRKSPIFLFSRPKIIQQTVCNWEYHARTKDYYPSLAVDISNNAIISGDFDTGAVDSYIGLEELTRKDRSLIPKRFQWGSSPDYFGGTFKYFTLRIKADVVGVSGRVKTEFDARIVASWEQSAFYTQFGNKNALFGRNMLNNPEFPLKLCFDSNLKQTDIL